MQKRSLPSGVVCCGLAGRVCTWGRLSAQQHAHWADRRAPVTHLNWPCGELHPPGAPLWRMCSRPTCVGAIIKKKHAAEQNPHLFTCRLLHGQPGGSTGLVCRARCARRTGRESHRPMCSWGLASAGRWDSRMRWRSSQSQQPRCTRGGESSANYQSTLSGCST